MWCMTVMNSHVNKTSQCCLFLARKCTHKKVSTTGIPWQIIHYNTHAATWIQAGECETVFVLIINLSLLYNVRIVGNKAKGRISKRIFQENKAHQIFRKTNISYPLIRTRTCAHQGVRMFVFRKIWRALFSWNPRFEIRAFALLPTVCPSVKVKKNKFASCLWKIHVSK